MPDQSEKIELHAVRHWLEKNNSGLVKVFEEAFLAGRDSSYSSSSQEGAIKAGTEIGFYKVLRKLSEGGMGSVFLATRKDDVTSVVAIKVLKRENLKDRFRKECQILSKLMHPNIARLYEANYHHGRPWFAMEYIQGDTLCSYLKKHNLTLKKRIDLFLKICSAVSYSHGRMIIHRDIKPNNIIVMPNGEPKLLDFGIAATIDTETGFHESSTMVGELMFTPTFASPEQIKGIHLTTTSDVYSLGIVLYILLTGKQPYTIDNENLTGLQQLVSEINIVKPSKNIDKDKVMIKPRQLQGDLDIICMKAMAQERGMRYGSVESFANDLKLHFKGMPIQSRPLTNTYRLRKFFQRNAWPTAMSSMVVILMVVFHLSVLHQQRRILMEKDAVQEERDRAERFLGVITSMFRQLDPDVAKGKDVSVLEMMESSCLPILNSTNVESRIKQDLMKTMGEVYFSLGRFGRSKQILANAIFDKNSADVKTMEIEFLLFDSFLSAGDLYEADLLLKRLQSKNSSFLDPVMKTRLSYSRFKLLFYKGRYLEAQGELKEAYRGVHLLRTEEQLTVHQDRAKLLSTLSLSNKSSQNQIKVLNMIEKLYGRNNSKFVKALMLLGEEYQKLALYDDASKSYDEAEEIITKIFGKDHPLYLKCLRRRASLLDEKGFFSESKAIYTNTLDQMNNMLGETNLVKYQVQNELIQLLIDMSELDDAENLARLTISQLESYFPSEHPVLADSINLYARIRLDLGDHASAAHLYRTAIKMKEVVYGELHPSTAASMKDLAFHLALQSDEHSKAEAKVLSKQSLNIIERSLGQNHPVYRIYLGVYRHALNLKDEEALRLSYQVLELTKNQLGDAHIFYFYEMANLGKIFLVRGDYEKAKNTLSDAMHGLRKINSEHIYLGAIYNLMGQVCFEMGDLANAAHFFRDNMNIVTKKHNTSVQKLAIAQSSLGKTQLELGCYSEAEYLLHNSFDIFRSQNSHELAIKTSNLLGYLYLAEGKLNIAHAKFEWIQDMNHDNGFNLKEEMVDAILGCALVHYGTSENEKAALYISMLQEEKGHPLQRSKILHLKALIARDKGDKESADFLFRQSLKISRDDAKCRSSFIFALIDYADFLASIKRISDARRHIGEANVLLRKYFPIEHELNIISRVIEGLILLDLGYDYKDRVKNDLQHLSDKLGEHHFITQKIKKRLRNSGISIENTK